MTEKPILFSAPMVLALLAGRKTQTRRVAKFVEDLGGGLFHVHNAGGGIFNATEDRVRNDAADYAPISVGDRLWVRETLVAHEQDDGTDGVLYRADGAFRPVENSAEAADRWCALHAYRGQRGATVPPIHAPRWTSRITLDVTDVRVERLQSISEADALAEGCFKGKASGRVFENEAGMNFGGSQWYCARDWYADLWNAINGPSAWASNPWVVAYTFRVHLCNIDRMEP